MEADPIEVGDDISAFLKSVESLAYYRPVDCRRFHASSTALRWLTTYSGALGEWAALVTHLVFDSDLFGMGEVRLEPLLVPEYFGPLRPEVIAEAEAFVAKVIEDARAHGMRHVTAPVKAGDTLGQLALQCGGFTMSDTIIVHGIDLTAYDGPLPSRSIRTAEDGDAAALAAISGTCFGNRRYNANRFNSDPAFDPVAVESLYQMWASKSVRKEMADEVLVYDVDSAPAGFITLSTSTGPSGAVVGTIPLNAVAPEHQGKGIYTDLVRAALLRLKARQASTVEIRTQLSNLAVHRTWQRLGGVIVDALHTFRLSIP